MANLPHPEVAFRTEAPMQDKPIKQKSEMGIILDRIEAQTKWIAELGCKLNDRIDTLIGSIPETMPEEDDPGYDNSYISMIQHQLSVSDRVLERLNKIINRLDGVL